MEEIQQELKELHDLLLGILGIDDNIRRQCEEKLTLLHQVPDKLLLYLVKLAQGKSIIHE